MKQSNPSNQRNENVVGPDGKQGGNFVNCNIDNPIFNIVQQPEQRRDPSTTTPLDEDVASFLARLHLNELTEIFRRQRLSMDDILELSNEELKDIGVDLLKHRKLIIESAEKMKTRKISRTGGAAQQNNTMKQEAERMKTKIRSSEHCMEDAPAQVVTLSATGWAGKKEPECLGDYSLTEQVHNGRQVYRKSNGWHLWSQEDGTWAVSGNVGYDLPGMKSTDAAVSPGLCQQWQYWVDWVDGDSKYKPGDITVTSIRN